jgi:hypothetical protein
MSFCHAFQSVNVFCHFGDGFSIILCLRYQAYNTVIISSQNHGMDEVIIPQISKNFQIRDRVSTIYFFECPNRISFITDLEMLTNIIIVCHQCWIGIQLLIVFNLYFEM